MVTDIFGGAGGLTTAGYRHGPAWGQLVCCRKRAVSGRAVWRRRRSHDRGSDGLFGSSVRAPSGALRLSKRIADAYAREPGHCRIAREEVGIVDQREGCDERVGDVVAAHAGPRAER